MTKALTAAIVTAATALTSGFNPSRAREKITMGNVVEPGPDKNIDNTTSSSDKVNVSNHADNKDCVISGSVIKPNTCSG